MFTMLNLLSAPVVILMSYISIAAWILVQHIEKLQATHVTPEQISLDEDIPIETDVSGNKLFEQIEALNDRDKDELRLANQEWYEKCEELSAEIRELKTRLETKEEMLLIIVTVLAMLITSYSCITYMVLLTTGFKTV
jgi:hypothetical protein